MGLLYVLRAITGVRTLAHPRQQVELKRSDIPAETLPAWDLSDLYAAPDAPEVQSDLERAAAAATALADEFKGRLGELDGDALAEMIARYEQLEECLGRAMSYAQLLHAADTEDAEIGRFFQTVQERVNEISTKVLFVTLELNRIEEEALEAKLAASDRLARYRPWIRDVRSFRPHQLDDEIERVLHEKAVTGRRAWTRLFDETMGALRFPVRRPAADQRRDLRSAAGPRPRQARGRGARHRRGAGTQRPPVRADHQHARQGQAAGGRLAQVPAPDLQPQPRQPGRGRGGRRADRRGQGRLPAPVASLLRAQGALARPGAPGVLGSQRALSGRQRQAGAWSEAKVIVLEAYRRFSPTLAEIVDRFFARGWIDAALRPGKDAGAFCHPTVPSVHPYVLMNYQGRPRDVMTLAHELGHGVHQTLAGGQGPLMAGTPLTLAETASVFGEQLTFRALLEAETDPVQRRVMLAGKIEDGLNTVVRQIAFVEFERRVHDARRQAELTADELGELWLEVQTESLGPAFHFDDLYRVYWSYIPHFIHVPFYVYAYAFGDCLVNSLYAVYQAEPEGFEARYLELLRAGGTRGTRSCWRRSASMPRTPSSGPRVWRSSRA